MDSFVFYESWYRALEGEPADIRLAVYDAIFEYAFNDSQTEMKPRAGMAFKFIKMDLDRSQERYENVRQARAAAGRRSSEERRRKQTSHEAGIDSDSPETAVGDKPQQNEQNQQMLNLLNKNNKTNKRQHNDNVDENVDDDVDKKIDFVDKKNPPPPLSEFCDTVKLYREMKGEIERESTTALDLVRQYGLERERLLKYLEAFQRKMNIEGERQKTRRDYRSHFNNWLRIQVNEGQPPEQGGQPPRPKNDAQRRLHNIGTFTNTTPTSDF